MDYYHVYSEVTERKFHDSWLGQLTYMFLFFSMMYASRDGFDLTLIQVGILASFILIVVLDPVRVVGSNDRLRITVDDDVLKVYRNGEHRVAFSISDIRYVEIKPFNLIPMNILIVTKEFNQHWVGLPVFGKVLVDKKQELVDLVRSSGYQETSESDLR
jgi:hypothetical protein